MSVIRPTRPKTWMTGAEFLKSMVPKMKNSTRVVVLVYIEADGSWQTVCQDARASELAFAALMIQHQALTTSHIGTDPDD